MRQKREADEAAAASEARKPVATLLSPLADAIEDGRGGFCDSIFRDMRAGNLPAGRGASLVCEIIAKKAGRKNSEAYEAEFTRIEKILEQAGASR